MQKWILYFIFIFTFQIYAAAAKPDRVEPLFWWTGMHQKELQISIHGENISTYDIQIKYPGVKILKKSLTDNPNYVFLYVEIGKRTKPGTFDIIFKKDRETFSYPYTLKARVPDSESRKSFSEADNLYLLMPDRFVNGNPDNDSVTGYHQGIDRSSLAKRHGGDMEGIISKIPYLADLGITALWTTPFFDNNDFNYSYHHYGCTDYYKIDPRLGKNEDYPRLSKVAAQNGIKLILDMVPNHCCSNHWWFSDMPDKNWFHTWPAFTSSNYRMASWTDPHASEWDRAKLIKGWFAPNMPDFNLSNPLVFDYLKQVYVFWIEYAEISGLRVDTYPYNDIKLAYQFVKSIRDEYPNLTIVGECWMDTPLEIAYYQSGNNNKDGFDSGLQSVMDFNLRNILVSAFKEKEGWNTGLARFYSHFAQDFAYANTNLLMNFVDNHDVDRLSTQTGGNVNFYKMALAMLLTVRGYPQIYYGTEIMIDGLAGTYEGHRYEFPGGWKDHQRDAFTEAGRTSLENEVFHYLKKLLHYRKNNQVMQNGKMKQFIPENGIYVYFRYNNNKTVMIIVNKNNEKKQLSMTRFVEMLQGKKTASDIMSGASYPLDQDLLLQPENVHILEIQ